MPTKIYVDGTDRTQFLHDGTVSVDEQIGGRNVARVVFVDKAETYKPSIREAVIITEDELSASGSMTGGLLTDKTVSVPSASFTSGDLGKTMEVPGAGPFSTTLHGIVAEILSGTSVRLNRHAFQSSGTVTVKWGWRKFAGIISSVGESAMVDDVGLITPVSVVDYTQVCDRRLVSETYPAGFTHDNLLNDIGVSYLDSNGLNIDEEIQAAGALPELTFDLVTATEVCNTVSEMLELVWYVDYCPLLYMKAASANPTPLALNTGNATVKLGTKAETEIGQYRNRVYLRYGSGTREVTETLNGDGSQREWVLTYTPQSRPTQVYDPQAVPAPAWKNVGVAGVDTLFEWVYDEATRTLEQLADAPPGTAHAALAVGASVTVTFVAVFPATVMREDLTEIGNHGDYDAKEERPDIFDPTAAGLVCDALLRKGIRSPKRFDVQTFERGFHPGQRGALTSTIPAASGNHLVESIRASLVPYGSDFQTWVYDLQMVEGDEPQTTWLDWWRGNRSSSSGSSGSITVGAPAPTPPTGGGGVTVFTAFLGGADPERRFTAASAATWFDAPWHVDLVLNGDLAGATAAVRVHLIVPAGGMTIQPRLYNTSTSAAAGTGTAVTPTSFTYQAFYVTLSPGVNVYRLQFNVSSTSVEYGYWQAICDNQG